MLQCLNIILVFWWYGLVRMLCCIKWAPVVLRNVVMFLLTSAVDQQTRSAADNGTSLFLVLFKVFTLMLFVETKRIIGPMLMWVFCFFFFNNCCFHHGLFVKIVEHHFLASLILVQNNFYSLDHTISRLNVFLWYFATVCQRWQIKLWKPSVIISQLRMIHPWKYNK